MDNRERFNSALYGVSERIRRVLETLHPTVKSNAQEIRIRTGLPVTLTVGGETVFITEDGHTSFMITKDLLKAQKSDLDESFRLLCRSSVYAHSNELKNGYVIMRNGHRAGIFGTLTENGIMRDVSSVNIRIAREIFGCANDIVKRYDGRGLLIAGPPGCGKTTVLRDTVRQLSDGLCGKMYRVAVIDSRGEISGSYGGECVNDLGNNTDVLMSGDKAEGIEIAIRTMFPDVVAFDEIGTLGELKGVSESFNAGVTVITTAHIASEKELMTRHVTSGLIRSGAVSTVALLPKVYGGKIKFIDTKELCRATAR